MNLENRTQTISADIVITKISLFSNIPFIILTIFIVAYYVHILKKMFQGRNLQEENFERKKDRNIRILVLKFICVILMIEFYANLCAMLSGIILGYDHMYSQKPIPLINSYRINVKMDYQLKMFPIELLAYLPSFLNISITPLLQPTVSLLLIALRRAYLDASYGNLVRFWFVVALLRSVVLFLMLSYYQTIAIGGFVIPIFHTIDYTVYLINSHRFHSLLKRRMEIARVQSSPAEYRDKLLVFNQYKITSAYTTLTFLIFTLKYSLYGIRTSIHGSMRLFCTMHYITLGFSPLIFYNSNILGALHRIEFYLSSTAYFLDYGYQILISVAYLGVCAAIGIRLYRKMKKFKQINLSIRPLVERYHRDFYL